MIFTFLSMVVTFSIYCSSANLYIFTKNLPSSLPSMTDQTQCHNCKCYIQTGRILCHLCKAYIHVPCSGLKTAMGCPAYDAYPKTLQKVLNPPTDHQPHLLSQLKMKRNWQHTKHLLIYRPQQYLQFPRTPGNLPTKYIKLD